MLKTTIIGASGYTGAELALMINRHPELTLSGLYVSANSVDVGKPIAALHGKLAGLIDMPVQPLTNPEEVAKQCAEQSITESGILPEMQTNCQPREKARSSA